MHDGEHACTDTVWVTDRTPGEVHADATREGDLG